MSELENFFNQLPEEIRKGVFGIAEHAIDRDRKDLFMMITTGKPDWAKIKKILESHGGRLDSWFNFDKMKFKIIISMRKIPEAPTEVQKTETEGNSDGKSGDA